MRKTGIILLFLLFGYTAQAQRINFKTFVQGDAITLTVVENPDALNFNRKQQIIVVGDPSIVQVNIGDQATVVVEIDAPMEYDITAELTWTEGLSYNGLDTGVTVPFALRFAYNNTGEPTDIERRASAVEVPSVFNTLTFPIRRKTTTGPPGPPPTPDHDGYVRPRAKAYLYFYGTLGPIPTGIRAGNYDGTIELSISYTDNAP